MKKTKGENNLNPAFDNISEEKRQKIIDVCIEEFAERGYEKASTNGMVSKAEISKGSLFHYFGNKKNLYLYLLDIAMDFFVNNFYKYETKTSSDLFERIVQQGVIKMKLASENPHMYKLVMEAFIDTPDDMKIEIASRYQKMYSEGMPNLFQDVDYSLFRDDIDTQRAIEFIMLCFDSIYNKYAKMAKGKASSLSLEEVEKMVQEYSVYIDMIKFGIYKKN